MVAALWTAVSVVVLLAQRQDAFQQPYNHPAIGYGTRPVHDRVAALNDKLDAGTAKLTFDRASGYLPALLTALDVPVESQMLVFSKTSAQFDRITPANPRALFFNDTVAVGWVRGSDILELAALDPQQGVGFYTIEQKAAEKPRLTKQVAECLQCHLTWDTLAVAGLAQMSTFQMSDDPNAYANGIPVDQRTPFASRWGGWFVTGKAVPARHLGNVPVIVPAAELAKPAQRPPVLQSVDGRFDTNGYLTHYSDVAALMVFGHQTHMTNLLTHLGWEARVATASDGPMPPRVASAARDTADYMLFVDEPPIFAKIEGSSGFAEKFSASGPRDAKGRSLKELDLTRRIMRYPCSYMIYSDTFDALPPVAKDATYRRLWQVLSGQDTDKHYAHLALADRQAIVEILRATKKDLPAYFQAVTR